MGHHYVTLVILVASRGLGRLNLTKLIFITKGTKQVAMSVRLFIVLQLHQVLALRKLLFHGTGMGIIMEVPLTILAVTMYIRLHR